LAGDRCLEEASDHYTARSWEWSGSRLEVFRGPYCMAPITFRPWRSILELYARLNVAECSAVARTCTGKADGIFEARAEATSLRWRAKIERSMPIVVETVQATAR
jgi:hypothetical protein